MSIILDLLQCIDYQYPPTWRKLSSILFIMLQLGGRFSVYFLLCFYLEEGFQNTFYHAPKWRKLSRVLFIVLQLGFIVILLYQQFEIALLQNGSFLLILWVLRWFLDEECAWKSRK